MNRQHEDSGVQGGPLGALDFGRALNALRVGLRVARLGWNGKGVYLFLVPGSRFLVNRPPLLGIYPEGTEITYRAHIDMCDVEGKISPWSGTSLDLLATDWMIVE